MLFKGNGKREKWNGTKKNHDKTFFEDVMEYQNGCRLKGGFWHPQALPEWFVEKMVLLLSNEGDIVYDPFMGSGTTAIVCRKLGRIYIGSEVNEKYYNMCLHRLGEEKPPQWIEVSNGKEEH